MYITHRKEKPVPDVDGTERLTFQVVQSSVSYLYFAVFHPTESKFLVDESEGQNCSEKVTGTIGLV